MQCDYRLGSACTDLGTTDTTNENTTIVKGKGKRKKIEKKERKEEEKGKEKRYREKDRVEEKHDVFESMAMAVCKARSIEELIGCKRSRAKEIEW